MKHKNCEGSADGWSTCLFSVFLQVYQSLISPYDQELWVAWSYSHPGGDTVIGWLILARTQFSLVGDLGRSAYRNR